MEDDFYQQLIRRYLKINTLLKENYIFVIWVENLSSVAQHIFSKPNCTINRPTNILLGFAFYSNEGQIMRNVIFF